MMMITMTVTITFIVAAAAAVDEDETLFYLCANHPSHAPPLFRERVGGYVGILTWERKLT